MHRVLPNICSDDEWVIVRVMLKPEICFGEGYWDMRPWGAKMLAFADMRDRPEVFFPLPLRLMHRLIGSSGDGIDDVYHASGVALSRGFICPLRDLPRL